MNTPRRAGAFIPLAIAVLPLTGCVVVVGNRSDRTSEVSLESGSSSGRRIGVVTGRPGPALSAQLDIDPDRAVVITEVLSGSSAQRAGLQRFDVITGVDGSEFATTAVLRDTVRAKSPGDAVTLRLIRAGQPMELAVPVESPLQANYYYN